MKTICNYIIFLFVLCLPVTLLAQKAENVDTIKTQFAEKNFLEHKVMEPYRGGNLKTTLNTFCHISQWRGAETNV